MIAALSCALLCGPLSASPAQALQCEKGQATLEFTKQGAIENGRADLYSATVNGKPGLDFSEVPGVSSESSLNFYFAADSIPMVALPYIRKVDTPSQCLNFSRRFFETETGLELEFRGGRGTVVPLICFASAGNTIFHLDVIARPARWLEITNPRIYVQGKRKDGSSYTLFDTSKPCKE
ncbi:hypothetical protein [Stenotrophomonas sp.]|uniref:hypothetical protein n=1 Tax=Stenotrophomonas sp. TaxID=69392 RepID=UPI0028A802F4|nr:hypothetical protein [Stenotrophomonas sp.]